MKNHKPDLTRRLEAVIDTAIDGIITIDQKGTVETVNKATCRLFGYAESDIVGNNIKMLMPHPYKGEHDDYIKRYNATKEPKIIGKGREVFGQKCDGTVFPMRLAVSEVILNDRIIFTGIVHDLSEIAEAKAEVEELNRTLEKKIDKRTYDLEKTVNRLINTNKELKVQIAQRLEALSLLEEREKELKASLEKEQELNELKSRFVSMASHEFRTPLTSIASSASLISRYDQSEQQSNRIRHLDKIKKAVTNLTGILNDFLSLSKLEEGHINLALSDVDLDDLCNEVHDSLLGILKKDQRIHHEMIGTPRVIATDSQILKNILFNLLSNAIKYSEADIHCKITYEEDQLKITIIDIGIGIPLEDQKHLFTRFFRAGNVINIQGTGLGLNIVRRYVQLLGGDISFTSTPYVGTTFLVSLPYLQHIS